MIPLTARALFWAVFAAGAEGLAGVGAPRDCTRTHSCKGAFHHHTPAAYRENGTCSTRANSLFGRWAKSVMKDMNREKSIQLPKVVVFLYVCPQGCGLPLSCLTDVVFRSCSAHLRGLLDYFFFLLPPLHQRKQIANQLPSTAGDLFEYTVALNV